jgi:hypothetical protein
MQLCYYQKYEKRQLRNRTGLSSFKEGVSMMRNNVNEWCKRMVQTNGVMNTMGVEKHGL